MTSTDFKINNDLVKSWREIRESELGNIVIGILNEESPLNGKQNGDDPMVHYGRILGYAEAVRKLEDLTQYTPVQPHPKRSYARKQPDHA